MLKQRPQLTAAIPAPSVCLFTYAFMYKLVALIGSDKRNAFVIAVRQQTRSRSTEHAKYGNGECVGCRVRSNQLLAMGDKPALNPAHQSQILKPTSRHNKPKNIINISKKSKVIAIWESFYATNLLKLL